MKVLYTVQDDETFALDVLICEDEEGGKMLEPNSDHGELQFTETHSFDMNNLAIIVHELTVAGLIVKEVPDGLQSVFLERVKESLH